MTFRLITADERLAVGYDKITGAIFGRAKVGKTTLVKSLRSDETLFINLEAGMKSLQDYRGPNIDIQTFNDAADAACLIGGIDPAAGGNDFYSSGHYDAVRSKYRDINPDWFRTFFWDSVTDLTRLGMTWAQRQPSAFNRYGKVDMRGAYGELGRQVVRMLRHVQHAPGKNVFFVGGLDHIKLDGGQEAFEPQAEGGKTKAELPFIVDQIITLSDFDYLPDIGFVHNFGKGRNRGLCCVSPNPWGLPAGDRSGRLEMIEEPHLGRLMEKINRPKAI